MRKIKQFAFFFSLITLFGVHAMAQDGKDYGKSIAIILRVTGENGIIKSLETVESRKFEGRAKNIYSLGSVHSATALYIEVFIEGEKLLEAYLNNPLQEKLESFEPDGSMNRSELVKEEGFVNLRFALPETQGRISLRCSQLDNDGFREVTIIELEDEE